MMIIWLLSFVAFKVMTLLLRGESKHNVAAAILRLMSRSIKFKMNLQVSDVHLPPASSTHKVFTQRQPGDELGIAYRCGSNAQLVSWLTLR
jgi:hypothetical protein